MDLYADDIKERLFVEVYNAKKLEGKLKNVVHECREDLVLVYRLSGYDERLKRDCDSVTEEQMTRWGVDVETLKRDAWANTMAKRPPIMIDMMDACHLDFSRKHLENDNPAPGGISPLLDMFIITNRMNNNGAIYMFDDETMQRVAGKLGDNLIILPSSVHETLIIPKDAGMELRDLEQMVQEVNQTQVAPQERLSDHVYEYDAKEHELFRSDRAGERAKQKEEKRDEKKERPSLKERLAEKKNDVMKMHADRKQPTADKKKEAVI